MTDDATGSRSEIRTPGLSALGWSAARAEALGDAGVTHQLARVAVEHRGFYDVLGLADDALELVEGATVTAPLRRGATSPIDFPAVGDWVDVEPAAGANDAHLIHQVLPRSSVFVRRAPGREPKPQVVGTNIDVVFVVSSLDGDLNQRRLERYLAVVWGGGAQPVVVLSKADGVDSTTGAEKLVAATAPDVGVIVSSIVDGRGIDEIRALVPEGVTAALVGSSGVGKSSIINELLGSEVQDVAETQKDGRGRHTTIRRHLLPIPGGGLLVDTPGMREVQLWDDAGLPTVFPEIYVTATECRFADCSHSKEPDCAVVEALASGEIDPDRMDGLRRLQGELEELEDEIERRRRGRRDPRR